MSSESTTDSFFLACPAFGNLLESPRLLRWLVTSGAEVRAGEVVCLVEADKVVVALESPATGVLRAGRRGSGDRLTSGETLTIVKTGAAVETPLPDAASADGIGEEDGAATPSRPSDPEIDLVEGRPESLSGMRRVVARRMSASHRAAPCFYLTTSVDMTACETLRQRLKAEKRKATYNDMTVKAVALALRERPALLGAFSDGTIWPRTSVNVGVALALDDGLVVPVVRDADRKSLDDVASEIRDFATRARRQRLTPDDYAGGVFTVSNMGSFDIDHFVAIVNPGESGILAIGKIEPLPVVRDGAVVVRPMMNITLSADHRVIDGAEGARFNALVKRYLENAETLPGC